tara:strand:+ start:1007 stop:1213 length:207 start_codon:yes stop_codon:yes gene_type:complete
VVNFIDNIFGMIVCIWNEVFARLSDAAKGLRIGFFCNSSCGIVYSAIAQEFSSSLEFKNRYVATTTDM